MKLRQHPDFWGVMTRDRTDPDGYTKPTPIGSWNLFKPTQGAIKAHMKNPGSRLGINLAQPIDGFYLVVVDIDGNLDENFEWLEGWTRADDNGRSLTKTGRGFHKWYRVPIEPGGTLIGYHHKMDILAGARYVNLWPEAMQLEWEDIPMMPTGMYDKLWGRDKRDRRQAPYVGDVTTQVGVGARNSDLSRWAFGQVQGLKDFGQAGLDKLVSMAQSVNLTYDPPLPDNEVEHIVAHAWKNWHKKNPVPEKSIEPFVLPIRSLAQLRARAESMPKKESVLGPFSTGEWGIIYGPPAVGKSMISNGMALAIANGTSLAGFPAGTRPRNVLLIDCEMTPQEIIPRWQGDHNRIFYCDTDLLESKELGSFQLNDPGWQTALMDVCKQHNIEVVIIDNLEYALSPVGGQKAFDDEVFKSVYPLTRWAKITNRLLIMLDHSNAQGTIQGRIQKMRGASFVWQLVNQAEQGGQIRFEGSFRPPGGKMRASFDDDRAWQKVWTYSVLSGWAAEGPASIEQQSINMHFEENMTSKEIAKELDVNIRAVQRWLATERTRRGVDY